MRIVCAVHDYPPNRVTGSARFARQVCGELAARGHQVTVVSSARARGHATGCGNDGVRVDQIARGLRTGWARQVRHRLRGWLGGDDFGLAGPLCSVIQQRIRRARPDLVLAIAAPTQEVVAAAQALDELSVPGVIVPFFHIHARDFVADLRPWMQLLSRFDRVLAATQEERAFLAGHGVDADPIETLGMFVELPRPVAPEEVRSWRRARGVGDALLVAGGGGYSRTKGVWTLARASRAVPDVRFVLFGGDDRARQQLEASVPVGPNVEFAGFIDEREKSLLLHAADLFAMPSSGDAFGLVYVEANACGTPALAADFPSMREVLGPGGIFVPPDDDGALVRAIRSRTLAEWRQPELARRARSNAQRFAQHAGLARLADSVERCAGTRSH